MIITAKNKVKKEDFWIEKGLGDITVFGKTKFRMSYETVNGRSKYKNIISYYMAGNYQWILPKVSCTIYIYNFEDVESSKLLKTIKL